MIAFVLMLILASFWADYEARKSERISREIIESSNKAYNDSLEKSMKEIKLRSESKELSAKIAKMYGTEDTWNHAEYDKKRDQELRDEVEREKLEELRKIREKLER